VQGSAPYRRQENEHADFYLEDSRVPAHRNRSAAEFSHMPDRPRTEGAAPDTDASCGVPAGLLSAPEGAAAGPRGPTPPGDPNMLAMIGILGKALEATRARPADGTHHIRMASLINGVNGANTFTNLPQMKDSDVNFGKHLRSFESALDCYGIKKDSEEYACAVMTLFGNTLAAGSTRRIIFDQAHDAARAQGRLPKEAHTVFSGNLGFDPRAMQGEPAVPPFTSRKDIGRPQNGCDR